MTPCREDTQQLISVDIVSLVQQIITMNNPCDRGRKHGVRAHGSGGSVGDGRAGRARGRAGRARGQRGNVDDVVRGIDAMNISCGRGGRESGPRGNGGGSGRGRAARGNGQRPNVDDVGRGLHVGRGPGRGGRDNGNQSGRDVNGGRGGNNMAGGCATGHGEGRNDNNLGGSGSNGGGDGGEGGGATSKTGKDIPPDWKSSVEKEFLRKLLMDESTNYMQMGPKDIYNAHPEFHKFAYTNFRTNLGNLKKSLNEEKEYIIFDEKAVADFKTNFPREALTDRGQPFWPGHPAEAKLKEDIASGKANELKPQMLWHSDSDYQQFTLEVFRSHIHQAKRTQVERANAWKFTRNKEQPNAVEKEAQKMKDNYDAQNRVYSDYQDEGNLTVQDAEEFVQTLENDEIN